jgi:hypothetical protein
VLDAAVADSVDSSPIEDGGGHPIADGGADVGPEPWPCPYADGAISSCPLVDASGDCAPVAPTLPTGGQCCGGTIPCVGNCVLLPNGQVGCDCYGIAGGCWPNNQPNRSMCCPTLHGCATALVCWAGQ